MQSGLRIGTMWPMRTRSRGAGGILCVVWIALICAATTSAGFASDPSNSKLGPHVMSGFTPGGAQILGAHPRVMKVVSFNDTDMAGAMMPAVRAYKAGTPDGLVVFRKWVNTAQKPPYTLGQDPTTCANDFWSTVLAPTLDALTPADRALIDYVEGPNECENTPCWGTVAGAQWFGNFWVRLADVIADHGYKPCAFSIPVGNPPGDESLVHQQLDAIVPGLRACKARSGAWSYHAYTNSYSTEIGTEIWFSLRYRQFYSYFAQLYPDLADMPLLLTEGGIDTGGDPHTSGWQAHVDATTYESWLTWHDGQLQQDTYVLGVTLYQIGDGWWSSFDLEPIAGWMAGYLDDNAPPPEISVSPTNLSVSIVINQSDTASFTVSNTGGRTLDYTLSESAGWLSVSPTSGSSTGEADTITVNYAATSLPLGTYNTSILVSDPAASNPLVSLPVSLTVTLSPIPGDFDNDLHVTSADVVTFIDCLAGPSTAVPFGCGRADFNTDGHVDQTDFGLLQRCMTGPEVFGTENCTQ